MDTEQLYKMSMEFFDHAKDICCSSVPFSEECRKMCEQNVCGNFGRNWTCPPAIGPLAELQQQLSAYNRCLIVSRVYQLQDSFDWEGMVNSGKNFQDRIAGLKNKINAEEPRFEFLALGAGACQLCETCSYQEQQPCRNPEEAIFSLEAFGIDVMRMMTENGLKYNNGPNTVTYVGSIFWRDGEA